MEKSLEKLSEMLKIYNVGIYTRLSREDENVGESESIQNQKDYVTRYVLDKGWNIVETYCDDGYSGTNFNRPDFIRMLGDIESGRINMVITKDSSRLGREYIETGYYMEKYFPSKGIRYIAISDNIDTQNYNAFAPFLSVMNDMYAGDISRKVRAVMNTKRNAGKFIGSYAPYGYKKSPEDRNKLLVDEEAAEVVKRIFSMYISGTGLTSIAIKFNTEGIICPSEYKRMHFSNYINPKSKVKLWSGDTIKSILVNPTYTGCLTQNKYKKISHKLKKLITLPKDQWITVDNTHVPIITKELFDSAQKLMLEKSNTHFTTERTGHLLTGFIYCGECGGRMTFTKAYSNSKVYCICSTYKRFGWERCSRHSILETALVEYISADIRRIAQLAIDKEKLLLAVQNTDVGKKASSLEKHINSTISKINEIKIYLKSLYEDKCKGIITEDEFVEMSQTYKRERDSLNSQLLELNDKKNSMDRTRSENRYLIDYIKMFTSFTTIDRTAIVKLIDKVYIHQDRKICIHYNFQNPEESGQ